MKKLLPQSRGLAVASGFLLIATAFASGPPPLDRAEYMQLMQMKQSGKALNPEQASKVARYDEWMQSKKLSAGAREQPPKSAPIGPAGGFPGGMGGMPGNSAMQPNSARQQQLLEQQRRMQQESRTMQLRTNQLKNQQAADKANISNMK